MTLKTWGAGLTSVVVIIISCIVISSRVQGFLVYLNINYYFWIDYAKPMEPQWRFAGLPNTHHHVVEVDEDVRLGIWHIKAEERLSRKVVLYLHGNGDTRIKLWSLKKYRYLTEQVGMDVIAMDYRGFADSTGYPTEVELYNDALAVFEWMQGHLQVDAKNIVVYGHSLGTSIASQLTSKLCELKTCPNALVMEAPFINILEVVHGFVPIRPLITSMKPYLKHAFPTMDHMKGVLCPIFMMHGSKDAVISMKHSELLRDDCEARNQNVVFVPIRGGTHENLIDNEKVQFQLKSFLL